MDLIDIGEPVPGARRDRFFARSQGTAFRAATQSDGTEIDLYDEIGWFGVTAKDFREKLKASGGDVTLRINSPGGDVFDGIAIYNDLVSYPGKVRVEITGVAASAASIVAMAGNEIVISENAFIMIHNAWVMAMGNRHDLEETAAILEKVDNAMARTYAARTKTGIRSVQQMMDAETWMGGKEAVEKGFATSLISAGAVGAKFDLSVFAHVPDQLRWHTDDGARTEQDIEKLLMRDAGKSRSQARALIREIRAGNTSRQGAMPGAGDLKLEALAAAVQSVRTVLK